MIGEIIFWTERKYEMLKVRLKVLAWAIKYKGKRNIPPEVLFDEMDKTMAELKENLMQAVRISPPQMTGEETQEERIMFKEIMGKIATMGAELRDVRDKQKELS